MEIVHGELTMYIKFKDLTEKENFLNRAIRPYIVNNNDFETKVK